MKQVKYEHNCDLCGKSLGDDKKYEGIRIIDDSDKSNTILIEQWDLCDKCFDKFNKNRKKALEFLKEDRYIKILLEVEKEINENMWNNPDWFPQLYGLDKELTKAYDERERKRKAGEPWKI